MMRLFRGFFSANTRLSNSLDRYAVPARLTEDGKINFQKEFVRRHLIEGGLVYDVGAGKQPFFSAETKQALGCRVVGLDIAPEELSEAPPTAYDSTITADITTYRGNGDGDVVICQTLLEHVPDVGGAMRAISSILKPGGVCLLFIPCRNSAFARLNLALPEIIKRPLLFGLFPSARRGQGFRSFYHRCTPRGIQSLAREAGLTVKEVRHYYMSGYFSVFFPVFVIWRAWTVLVYTFGAESLCETFSMALVKD